MGVEFRTDFIVGKTTTVDELFAQGFQAVFLGTGAGLPHLMNIPGENLIGVYTANELLTRLNLMEAYRFPEADTPVRIGARTVVVGGGNSAMDAARWARRMGSETTIMFRRGRCRIACAAGGDRACRRGRRAVSISWRRRFDFWRRQGRAERDGMHTDATGRKGRVRQAIAQFPFRVQNSACRSIPW